MFKNFLFLILFVLASFTASAQYLSGAYGAEPIKGESLVMKYAAKVGMNLTTMSSKGKDVDFGMAPGFQIGAACNIRWGYKTQYSKPGTGILGFQPELLYSFQSVAVSGNDALKMNRIAMPLMLRAYPFYGIYFEAGPEFSYLISTSPESVAVDPLVYSVGECSGLAADIAIGAGWESKMGITAGIRYGAGITAIARNLPWRTHNISVSVGWMF